MRRATDDRTVIGYKVDEFLSTPSVRRATGPADIVRVATNISIHALREEGDSA